jgi:multiple sugar transport system permease protein/raffinose/stachyose/melibiose transport system permease protein
VRPVLDARVLKRTLLLGALALYTCFSAGPFLWVGVMSFRTTSEISADPYALPETMHWEKYVQAWTTSNYGTYFWNSTVVVVVAVVVLTLIGSMAAHCLARYRFPGNRLVLFIIFSTLIFPPQITIISMFQVLVEYGIYDTLFGLTLVYIAIQLPLTVYILEGFFGRIPQDFYDAAKLDGYGHVEIFWRITLPIGIPAVATTVILNFISLWNEFLYAVVLITDESNRTLPLGIQKFMGDQLEDIGMISTGLMIAIVPVIVVYVFFSERLIQGMAAGAVK